LFFVFDTNALISALILKGSVSRKAFDRALELGVILLSSATFGELNAVSQREKFRLYVDEDERVQFLLLLLREVEWVEISGDLAVCRDPRDDKFLETALKGGASYLVSGDPDLLILHPFEGVQSVRPGDFLREVFE
jgi:putative PIN family toxin of toxin-antitoxin system